MTSSLEVSTSSGSIDISPPKKSVKNHYYSPIEDRNMSNPIPINRPRMPPSNPSASASSSSCSLHHHRESYEKPSNSHSQSYSHSQSSRENRGESPSSGRSPTISHSYNRSHPYPRRTSSNSQPERERESIRDRERERERERERDRDRLPRIHLPPPNSIGSFKFTDNRQLSPIEREFPSLSTGQHESSWRSGSTERPQIHRIPSGGSVGKSGGISLPPLHSISGSPKLPICHMPPPSLDTSSSGSTAKGSPRMYPPNVRPGYNPYDNILPQRKSPSAGPSKLREGERERDREYAEHQAAQSRHPQPQHEYHTREPSREELYDLHRRSSSAHSTVPLPNHPSSLPSHHMHQNQQSVAQQQQHHHSAQAYDMPSPPLRALPPSSMPPMSYMPVYGHRGGGQNLARSRSQTATPGFGRHGAGGIEGEESSSGGPTPTPGQSRRLAHLMSEQKRRESINSGFQALRQALPSSLPTDSKAIILRKAVSHITQLENIIRRSGLTYSNSPPNGPGLDGPNDMRQIINDNWSNSNEEIRDRDRDSLIDEDENDRARVKWEEER